MAEISEKDAKLIDELRTVAATYPASAENDKYATMHGLLLQAASRLSELCRPPAPPAKAESENIEAWAKYAVDCILDHNSSELKDAVTRDEVERTIVLAYQNGQASARAPLADDQCLWRGEVWQITHSETVVFKGPATHVMWVGPAAALAARGAK